MKKDLKKKRAVMSKKLCTLMLAGTLVFGMAATGCKKDVNLGGDDGSDVSNVGADDDGNIEGKVGIPKSCDESFDVGASGLSKITLEDDEIQAPKSSSMSVVYCEKIKYDNAAKQKVAEALFDKSAGIYAYDYEHQTKSDLEQQIADYKEEKKLQEEQGYTDEWVNKEMQNLESQLASAPDEYPAAGDYSSEQFLGSMNGKEFTLSFSNGYSEDENLGVANGYLFMKQDVMDYRPCEGATDGWFGDTDRWGEIPEGSNEAKMTKDEAEQAAMEYLSQICQSEMEITGVKNLVWIYINNATGEDIASTIDGYCITFSKVIEGEKTLDLNIWDIDNLSEENASIEIPVEGGQLCMDDNGLLSLHWTEAYVPTGEEEKNVSILSWSEIMTKLNENLGAYYEKYPTRYKKVEYNDIRLTYFPLPTDKEGVIAYTPAWVLSQYEELADEAQYTYPTQLVVINAIDGTIIDLKDTAKALGTYYDYSEMDDEEGDEDVEGDDTTDGDDSDAEGDDTSAAE